MQTVSVFSHIFFTIAIAIAIAALSMLGSQDTHAQGTGMYVRAASKSTFDDLYGDHHEMVFLVTGDDHCAKSYNEANELKKMLALRVARVPVVNVVIVNRLIDSVAFRESHPASRPRFVKRGDLSNWNSSMHEGAWFYYCTDSSALLYCPFSLDEGSEALFAVLNRKASGERKLLRTELTYLDESEKIIVKPTFNQ